MCGVVVSVCVLRRLRLQCPGKRVEVRAQQRDVVHAESAADCCLVVMEETPCKPKARHKAQVRIFLQSSRITGLLFVSTGMQGAPLTTELLVKLMPSGSHAFALARKLCASSFDLPSG